MIIPNNNTSPLIKMCQLVNTCYMTCERRRHLITHLVKTHNLLSSRSAKDHATEIISSWIKVFIEILLDSKELFYEDQLKEDMSMECNQELIMFGYEPFNSQWSYYNFRSGYTADDKPYFFDEEFSVLREQYYKAIKHAWLGNILSIVRRYSLPEEDILDRVTTHAWSITPITIFNGIAELVLENKSQCYAVIERERLGDILVTIDNKKNCNRL